MTFWNWHETCFSKTALLTPSERQVSSSCRVREKWKTWKKHRLPAWPSSMLPTSQQRAAPMVPTSHSRQSPPKRPNKHELNDALIRGITVSSKMVYSQISSWGSIITCVECHLSLWKMGCRVDMPRGWKLPLMLILQGLGLMSQCFTSPTYWGYNLQQIFVLVMWNKSPIVGTSIPTPVLCGFSASFFHHFSDSQRSNCWHPYSPIGIVTNP